jgi:hypothetical protein
MDGKMTALCKVSGCLILMSTATAVGQGKCPVCKGTEFRAAPYGWVECITDSCDFAVLAAHLKRMPDDIANQIGAWI